MFSFSRNLLVLILAVSFSACESTNEPQEDNIPEPDRIFIPAYGSFGSPGSAALSVYHFSGDSVETNAFKRYNNKSMYDGAQSVVIDKNYLFVACTDANIVSIIDIRTMKETSVISFASGTGPNYMANPGLGYIYLTGVYSGFVYKISSSSFSIVDSVKVGRNPVQLAAAGNKLFVANSGYGSDSTISVIDLGSFKVSKTIITRSNPTFLKKFSENQIIWLVSGDFLNPQTKPAGLFILETTSDTVTDSLIFSGSYVYGELAIDGNRLFLNNNGIKTISITNGKFSAAESVTSTGGNPFVAGGIVFSIAPDYSNDLVRLIDGRKYSLGNFPSGNAVVSYAQ